MKTAAQLGLARCHVCGTLEQVDRGHCPRCLSALHLRKPDSLNRSWALLIAATILYIPANLLPMMTVVSLGQGAPSTIMEGVILLLHEGMWPIALVVFLASIFIPVLKLVVLAGLFISVQRCSAWQPAQRTRLYRMTHFIGRWSMVDVFVVAILAALVQLGDLVQIHGNAGATVFSAVVILTMLAAESFDPRLIWDDLESNK